jgi:hypothetical protein
MEEIWKDIQGYEGLYSVSNLGNVKGKWVLKPATRKDDYMQVGFHVNNVHKYFLVHRLVATAFIPNPLNLEMVNHKDTVKSNCAVYNLEWCTRSENTIHSYANNLQSQKGSINGNSKLTESDVLAIRALKGKMKQYEIAEKYGVSPLMISFIIRRKNWTNI